MNDRLRFRFALPTSLLAGLLVAMCCTPAWPAGNTKPVPAAAPANSSTDVTAEEPAKRWYQVELLVYRQKPVPGEIAENWPVNVTLSYPPNLLNLHNIAAATLPATTSTDTLPVLLDEKQKNFNSVARALRRNSQQILFHETWHEYLVQDDPSPISILVTGGQVFGDHHELEGSITLTLSRYLHISTNLWLTSFRQGGTPADTGSAATTPTTATPVWPTLPPAPDMVVATSPATGATDASGANVTTPAPAAAPNYVVSQIVTMKDSRRMRSNELHYLDHPMIGVLVKLIPLDDKTRQPVK